MRIEPFCDEAEDSIVDFHLVTCEVTRLAGKKERQTLRNEPIISKVRRKVSDVSC